jgi:hypothetical protein
VPDAKRAAHLIQKFRRRLRGLHGSVHIGRPRTPVAQCACSCPLRSHRCAHVLLARRVSMRQARMREEKAAGRFSGVRKTAPQSGARRAPGSSPCGSRRPEPHAFRPATSSITVPALVRRTLAPQGSVAQGRMDGHVERPLSSRWPATGLRNCNAAAGARPHTNTSTQALRRASAERTSTIAGGEDAES